MEKNQFAALFFAISLLNDNLNPFVRIGFIICSTIAFVSVFIKSRDCEEDK